MDKTHANYSSAKRDFNQDVQKIKDKVCETCGAISDTAQHARQHAEAAMSSKISDLKDSQDELVDYIKAHPLKSIGWALLAGFIAAKIL